MADGCLTRTLEGDELEGTVCGDVWMREGRMDGQTSFGKEGEEERHTRQKIFRSLLEGSIL